MSAKTATVRLYVAIVALLAAVLTAVTFAVGLVGALLRLLGASVTWLASRIGKVPSATTATTSATVTTAATRPNLRVVEVSSKADQLVSGLVGMGFAVLDVRAFVKGLGDRVEKEPMADLIKGGIAHCAKSRAS